MILQIDVSDARQIIQKQPLEIEFIGFVDLSNKKSSTNAKQAQPPCWIYPKMAVDEPYADKLSDLIIGLIPSNTEHNNGDNVFDAIGFIVPDFSYKCDNLINDFKNLNNYQNQREKSSSWISQNLPRRQN